MPEKIVKHINIVELQGCNIFKKLEGPTFIYRAYFLRWNSGFDSLIYPYVDQKLVRWGDSLAYCIPC